MMLFNGVDEYCPSLAAAADEEEEYDTPRRLSAKKTKMMRNKKRFSNEQIRYLESVFEKDSKLESRKKAQVARELGLQPRQVAIWFQNKRARFKSKQLERDYDSLAADYRLLASRFGDLEQEKRSLIKQLERLNDLLNRGQSEGTQRWKTTMGAADIGSGCSTGSSDQSDDQNRNNNSNDNDKAAAVDINHLESRATRPALSLDGSDYGMGILSDDGCCSDNTNYFGMEGTTTPLLMVANIRSTMETLDDHDDDDEDDDWGQLHADNLLLDDHSANHWMDFMY